MRNARSILGFVIACALTLGPTVTWAADAVDNAGAAGDERFLLEWEIPSQAQVRLRVRWEREVTAANDTVISGFVENSSPIRVGDVHLRVEALDQ